MTRGASSWLQVRPADLRPDAVFVTPRGRLCRLLPAPERNGWPDYQFAYVGNGGAALVDGFWLSESNLRILRVGLQVPHAR